MRRQINLPGQLPLDFESSYLRWIDSRGETFDTYETTTKKLLAMQVSEMGEGPNWSEYIPTMMR